MSADAVERVQTEIANAIYRLATKLDGITEITALLTRETRSRSCGLMIQNKADYSVHGGWYWGIDQIWGLAYQSRYFSSDPSVVEHFAIPEGQAYASPLNKDNAEFRNTAFFSEWCAPQSLGYFAGVYANLDPPLALRLTFQGDFARGPYEPETVRFMQEVLPHVRRAVGINREVTQLIGHTRAFEAMLAQGNNAIVLLNLAGEVIHVNESAQAMAGRGFAIRERRFHVLNAEAQQQAQAAITACCAALSLLTAPVMQAGCHVSIPRPAALPVSLYISPFRLSGASPNAPLPSDMVMIQIINPDSQVRLNEHRLREVMGLTAAEARVAALLCCGDSAIEIAHELSISPHTVRDHVKHIYQRIGVTKQSEFVARAYSVLLSHNTA